MQITVSARHMGVTESLKDYCEEKAGRLERFFNRIQSIEVVLDGPLAPAGDEDYVRYTRLLRLFDAVLDERFVDQGQHFLRHGLGGGKEPGSKPPYGKDGFLHGHGQFLFSVL